MPFEHAMVNGQGEVRPCCSWDVDVDKPGRWPNIQDAGLEAAVQHKSFKEVRRKLLAQEDVDGCRKCHQREQFQGSSFRTARLLKNKDWISKTKFNENTYTLRYLETAFSSLCNLACRMCWHGVSSTFHRITRPGKKIEMGYNFPTELFDTNLKDMTEIKVVGGEPLMEKKHDNFIDKLIADNVDRSNLELIYHTNCTVLPSQRVLDFWKTCKSVQLSLSIDSYADNNIEQRPGPYTWNDLLTVANEYKRMADEWGNIHIAIGATVTKINVFHIHEMEQWVKDFWNCKNFIGYDVQCAERPPKLSITDWHNDPVRKSKVLNYVNTYVISPHIRNHIKATIEDEPAHGDVEGFWQDQKHLDAYFGTDINEYV